MEIDDKQEIEQIFLRFSQENWKHILKDFLFILIKNNCKNYQKEKIYNKET